jgi:hypothetical protein
MDKKRYLEDKLNRLLELFPAVALIGPRQCGKSTLVKQIRPDWQYYDLENPQDYQLIANDPVAFFNLHPGHVIIDEAQQYPELFKVLRGVIDDDRKYRGRFILTGSSSPHIVKGITESLAGRIATIEMWTFKQGEFYETPLSAVYQLMTQQSTKIADFNAIKPNITLAQSMHCWHKGGFPEPLIEAEHNKDHYNFWLENYVADYLNRDIRTLFPRLNIHNFRRFLTLLAQFSGHQLNMSNMARALEVTVATVKDYLDIIHQTFIWRNLQPYIKNPLKKVQKSNKGFFRDQGLLHYYLKINELDQLLLHPVAGVSFESFVIEEIIRGLQSTMATQLDFNYYRTIDKSEVDLIIEGTFGTIPVEVKLSSTVKRQSLYGLENFISDMGCKYGILINRAKRVELLTDKIIQIPVHYL